MDEPESEPELVIQMWQPGQKPEQDEGEQSPGSGKETTRSEEP